MRLLKKNQVVVFVIGLMLITAGYLNFTNNENSNDLLDTSALADSEKLAGIGDAQLVSTTPKEEQAKENKVEEQKQEEKQIQENKIEEAKQEEPTKETNTQVATDEYFTKSKLERDTMYSQTVASYQKILENINVSETQKATAQKEITKINEQKNAIMITENLIKTKGFEDLVIFINGNSINVIIKAKELKKDQIAQIQNIITRELSSKIENIHISNKS